MNDQFSAEAYFATQPPPPTLDEDVAKVREFIDRQTAAKKRVAFVTSGGTTVPLEHNVVRFLDNFSAGTRGATSAEYFLQHGYAVIFMHRQYSLKPFSRHYSHSVNPFLDFLDIVPRQEPDHSALPPAIQVNEDTRCQLAPILSTYKKIKEEGTLHTLTFVTINDYLFLLRALSKELSRMGSQAIYYLAAAVSDFFLPTQKMSEHKIQSGKGSLIIEMDQVPKILKPLVDEWTPEGFIVSFKLETDNALLIPKARAALERYGHQVVIGNNLNTRKYEIVFVTRSSLCPTSSSPSPIVNGINGTSHALESPDKSNNFVERWLRLSSDKTEIEEDLIDELIKYHDTWIRHHPSKC